MTPTFLSRLSQDSDEALKAQLELFLRRAPGAWRSGVLGCAISPVCRFEDEEPR